ncbi:hypothetical protein [Thalassobius sp. Cn5-15]|uniref:hypothetical protein n=1 Tax=Thalassobius sp. Cn5-15 TaxID=2917763 RepID=UPI001EF3D478|nr:hypothetical protein [Thalassobius sp. Cn5-15]MCG7492414.1 hypothetical protein [Thalassobius sp. Cn5-15]
MASKKALRRKVARRRIKQAGNRKERRAAEAGLRKLERQAEAREAETVEAKRYLGYTPSLGLLNDEEQLRAELAADWYAREVQAAPPKRLVPYEQPEPWKPAPAPTIKEEAAKAMARIQRKEEAQRRSDRVMGICMALIAIGFVLGMAALSVVAR